MDIVEIAGVLGTEDGLADPPEECGTADGSIEYALLGAVCEDLDTN